MRKFVASVWYIPFVFWLISVVSVFEWIVSGELGVDFWPMLLAAVVTTNYSKDIAKLSGRVDMLDDENDYLHKKVRELEKVDSKKVARDLTEHWKNRPL